MDSEQVIWINEEQAMNAQDKKPAPTQDDLAAALGPNPDAQDTSGGVQGAMLRLKLQARRDCMAKPGAVRFGGN